MLQSLATLVFAAAALSALLMIAGFIVSEWHSVRSALGLLDDVASDPLPPRIRMVPARRVPILRVTPGALRRAA